MTKTVILKIEVPDGWQLITKSIILWKEGVMIPTCKEDIMTIGQKRIQLPTDEEINNEAGKIKLLRNFAEYLYSRGLANNPEEWDYEMIAWEYFNLFKEGGNG